MATTKTQNEIQSRCDEFFLSEKHNLTLHRFYQYDYIDKKKYLTDLIVYLNNEQQITQSFAQTIEFKEELFLFFRGDAQNKFLELVKRTLNKEELRSLALTKKNGGKIYFSQAECMAMGALINYSLHGFSLTRLASRSLSDAYNLELDDIFCERNVR